MKMDGVYPAERLDQLDGLGINSEMTMENVGNQREFQYANARGIPSNNSVSIARQDWKQETGKNWKENDRC